MNSRTSTIAGLIDIDAPVRTQEFVEKFTAKFQKWGNMITPALQETWRLNCLTLNNAVHAKDKVMKYIVSAPTGSAKTENTITYCAMLPDDIKVLISTNLTDEADRLAEDINKEASGTIACAYHSKNAITIEEASTYQIGIVSHEFYRRHNMGDVEWNKLGEYRDLIIIDEALDTLKEISVSSTAINRAITLFSSISDMNEYKSNKYFEKELHRLKDDLESLNNAPDEFGKGTKLIRSNKLWTIPTEHYGKQEILSIEVPSYELLLSIIEENKNIKYNYILTAVDNSADDSKISMQIKQTLLYLNQLKGRQVYITANRGKYSYNRVVDSTPYKSLVCFDATADVNKAYDMRAKYHKDLIRISKVPNVRDYSSVTMHTVSSNTGNESIDNDMASTILNNVTLGEKTLIVTHKGNEAYFKQLALTQYADYIIDVAHWSALTGLNKWQDFDTCIIAGLNHKPKRFSQNRVIINSHEDIAFGEFQGSLNAAITETDIVAEIIQAINRIRIRKVTNMQGGCESANIYVTLPKVNNKAYVELIKLQMPAIKVADWHLPGTKTSKESGGHFDTIINYLQGNLKKGDKMLITKPRDTLSINKESYRSIIGKKDADINQFKERLLVFGFEIIDITESGSRGRPKKNPTQYFHHI